jgi:hypothetical protein
VAGDSVKAVRSRSAPAWVRVSISSLYRLHKSRKTNNLPGPSTANREYRSSFFWRFFWGDVGAVHLRTSTTTTRTTTTAPVWHEREKVNFFGTCSLPRLSEPSHLIRISGNKRHRVPSPPRTRNQNTSPTARRRIVLQAARDTNRRPHTSQTQICRTTSTPTQPEPPTRACYAAPSRG